MYIQKIKPEKPHLITLDKLDVSQDIWAIDKGFVCRWNAVEAVARECIFDGVYSFDSLVSYRGFSNFGVFLEETWQFFIHLPKLVVSKEITGD